MELYIQIMLFIINWQEAELPSAGTSATSRPGQGNSSVKWLLFSRDAHLSLQFPLLEVSL